MCKHCVLYQITYTINKRSRCYQFLPYRENNFSIKFPLLAYIYVPIYITYPAEYWCIFLFKIYIKLLWSDKTAVSYGKYIVVQLLNKFQLPNIYDDGSKQKQANCDNLNIWGNFSFYNYSDSYTYNYFMKKCFINF